MEGALHRFVRLLRLPAVRVAISEALDAMRARRAAGGARRPGAAARRAARRAGQGPARRGGLRRDLRPVLRAGAVGAAERGTATGTPTTTSPTTGALEEFTLSEEPERQPRSRATTHGKPDDIRELLRPRGPGPAVQPAPGGQQDRPGGADRRDRALQGRPGPPTAEAARVQIATDRLHNAGQPRRPDRQPRARGRRRAHASPRRRRCSAGCRTTCRGRRRRRRPRTTPRRCGAALAPAARGPARAAQGAPREAAGAGEARSRAARAARPPGPTPLDEARAGRAGGVAAPAAAQPARRAAAHAGAIAAARAWSTAGRTMRRNMRFDGVPFRPVTVQQASRTGRGCWCSCDVSLSVRSHGAVHAAPRARPAVRGRPGAHASRSSRTSSRSPTCSPSTASRTRSRWCWRACRPAGCSTWTRTPTTAPRSSSSSSSTAPPSPAVRRCWCSATGGATATTRGVPVFEEITRRARRDDLADPGAALLVGPGPLRPAGLRGVLRPGAGGAQPARPGEGHHVDVRCRPMTSDVVVPIDPLAPVVDGRYEDPLVVVEAVHGDRGRKGRADGPHRRTSTSPRSTAGCTSRTWCPRPRSTTTWPGCCTRSCSGPAGCAARTCSSGCSPGSSGPAPRTPWTAGSCSTATRCAGWRTPATAGAVPRPRLDRRLRARARPRAGAARPRLGAGAGLLLRLPGAADRPVGPGDDGLRRLRRDGAAAQPRSRRGSASTWPPRPRTPPATRPRTAAPTPCWRCTCSSTSSPGTARRSWPRRCAWRAGGWWSPYPWRTRPDETYGHVRTVSLDDLHRWGRGTGCPYEVHEFHGGWLVVDKP